MHPPEPVDRQRVRSLDLSGQGRPEDLALELGAADAPTQRLPCPPPRHAGGVLRRPARRLLNFLNEQGPATTGDLSLGTSSARAAVSTGHEAADPSLLLWGGHHPQAHRPPPWTRRPWWRASRPNPKAPSTVQRHSPAFDTREGAGDRRTVAGGCVSTRGP
jgi:hypothetical protein